MPPTNNQRTIIDEIQEALERATPGTWDWEPGEYEDFDEDNEPVQTSGAELKPPEIWGFDAGDFWQLTDENAKLIALLHNNAQPLLDVVRAAAKAEVYGWGYHEKRRLREALRNLDPRLLGDS